VLPYAWVDQTARQTTHDSTHVLAAVRALDDECVGETLRHTLNVLATVVPEWLSEITPADWFERYSSRIEASHYLELRPNHSSGCFSLERMDFS